MADDHYFANLNIAVSSQWFKRLQWNLARWRLPDSKPHQQLKIWFFFQNPKWRRPLVLKCKNKIISPQRSSYRNKIWQGDVLAESSLEYFTWKSESFNIQDDWRLLFWKLKNRYFSAMT